MPGNILKQLQNFLSHPEQVWPYPRLFLDTIVSGLVLCMTVILTLRAFGAGDGTIYGENGILETLQVVALCAASLLSILAAVRLRPAGRFVAATTALLCLTFFIREMPSCRPDIILACVPRASHRIVPAVCGSVILLQVLWMYRTSLPALLRMIHPAFSWPLLFVATFLLMGELWEELHHQPLEEIFELLGYMGLLLSSIWMLQSSFQTTLWSRISEIAAAFLRRLHTSYGRGR